MTRVGVSLILACGVALAFGADGVRAEQPAPFPEFTFKKIKPPKPGQKVKIPQIEPVVQKAAPVATAAQGGGVTGSPGGYGWFWEQISPEMAQTGPGRLEPALIRLANPPVGLGVSAPRLQDLHAIAKTQGAALLLNTVGTRVSPALVLAVISVESGGRADAVSGAGARGLMQLIPATAERFGVADSMDPAQNIKGGVAYLDWLLREFDGDPILAIAAYNAGENAVKKHAGVPPFAETRDYVPKVLAAFAVAKGLCQTPPMLISDGCVFNLGG